MSKRTVNLDTYSLSLLTAKEDILNPRSSTNWALFAYDGVSNKLKLADSGVGGVTELAGKFHISKPQYGFCKVGTMETGAPRIAMIIWVGQNVEEYRRTECTSHIPDIKSFFKEAHAFIRAEKVEDVTEENIRAELSKVQSHAPTQWARRSSKSADKEELVGTNYRKTNAAMEMRRINRDSFWARAEREEEERKEEERRRAAEERRRLERERVLQERKDAEERDRKMNEKLEMIEEQRRKQAEEEELMHKKEKLKWEEQQREHEEDMRARLKRSESIEKAAEAAALVSQRSMNPREFFRQLSASSQSPTSPGSSRTGKPFRRYQRSLTDTAFIFSKAEESSASSPRSSPLVSPFSRAPPSPSFRAMSPPTSPDFRPVTSPPRPRAPISPPTSPARPSAPLPALLGFTQTNSQDEPRAMSPTEPSAPPASPTLLASFPPSLAENTLSEAQAQTLADLPSNIQSHFELDFSPHAPTASLPKNPQSITDLNTVSRVHTELVSDIGYKVQAVLVEEDEEEDEEEREPETLAKLCNVDTEPDRHEEEEEEPEEVKEDEDKMEQQDGDEEPLDDTEPSLPGTPVEATQVEEVNEDEDDQSADYLVTADLTEVSDREESALTDAELICQDINHEIVILSTNGILNGSDAEKQNGIVRSLSPSDTELSTAEMTGCFNLCGTAEDEDFAEDKDQGISENGEEGLAQQQLCVRALYDYQAEDESEISFEPGDIIKDVETVDKAWWRGWSKDGRQGLFPASFVETI